MPFLRHILIEPPGASFDPNTDLQEMFELPGTQPGGGDTLSQGNGEAVLVYLIDWHKARSFARWALGFAYPDEAAPYKLHREHPAYHPRFPQLSAATVHFSSVAPKSNPTGTPANTPNYPAVLTSLNSIPKTGYYQKCYATVRFVGGRTWQFHDDDYLDNAGLDESARYTFVNPTPVVDLLTVDGGASQLKWSEGGGADNPTVNEAIANTVAERVSKVRLLLKWMWVPEEYLSTDTKIFFPQKVFDCAGRVNSVPFLGRPAGTVLCDAPQMERFEFPVTTFDGYSFYGWNLTVPLVYFNPPLGVPDTNPLDNTKARGHRTLPWRENGLWWGAKRKNGSWYLAETDLNRLFEHISKP